MDRVRKLEERLIAERGVEVPVINPGDTITVYYKVIEAGRERIQPFTGVVVQVRNSGIRKTVTVRKISDGVGVERIFPVYSPRVEKIEIVRRGKVRRKRIFYIREKVGKDARIKERRNNALLD